MIYILVLLFSVFALIGAVHAADIALLPHVPDNATLSATKSTAYDYLVRDDFSIGFGAPQATYKTSILPCSLNAGVGDGGAQIRMVNGGCANIAPPVSGTYDIRIWGAPSGADIVPYMAKAYASGVGGPILIPSGVWQVQSATTFSNGIPNFVGVGWGEHNQGGVCPTSVTGETWLHQAVGSAGITPFTLSGATAAGDGGFHHIAVCQDQPAPSAITASIAGTTLTVTVGSVSVGQGIGGAGVPSGTVISSGTGPYTLNNSATVASEAMTAWKPTVYQPVVNLVGVAGQVNFDDVYAYSVYAFLNATSFAANGRLMLTEPRGQVFSYFANLDRLLDTSHGSGGHFFGYWNVDASVMSWQQVNGNVMILGRVDGFQWPGLFAYGYNSCVEFIDAGNGVSTGSAWPGYYCDGSRFGVYFNAANSAEANFPDAYIGGGSIPNSWGLNITNSTNVHLLVGNLQTSATGGGSVLITGASSGSVVDVANGWLHDLNIDNNGSAVLSNVAGSTIRFANTPDIGGVTNSAPTNAGAGLFDVPSLWMTYTPTITCGSGTLTSATASGLYRQHGTKTDLELDILDTTNGTCAVSIAASLPNTGASAKFPLYGREIAITGNPLQGIFDGSTQVFLIVDKNNAYPGGSGNHLVGYASYKNQ